MLGCSAWEEGVDSHPCFAELFKAAAIASWRGKVGSVCVGACAGHSWIAGVVAVQKHYWERAKHVSDRAVVHRVPVPARDPQRLAEGWLVPSEARGGVQFL